MKTHRIRTFLNFMSLSVIFGIFSFASNSSARELQGRLGVGYSSEFSTPISTTRVPGVSLKYAFSRDLATEAIVGFSTSTLFSSVTGLKFFKNIFFETNLNFYFMVGGAILNANHHTGLGLIGGLGTEFFIPGLESLGFAVETGGQLTQIGGSLTIATLGVSFLDAGIHFYF